MYPIIKPNLGIRELVASITPGFDVIETFEDVFAKKIGRKYAIAFPYGRSALYSAFKALGIKGTEVLTPAYTCIVVQNAIVLSGNKPTFSDLDLKDFNMKIKGKQKEKIIVPTQLYGYPLDVKKIKKDNPGAMIIEDSCLGPLSDYNKIKSGTLGDLAFFSFNISKHITTFDGGIILTDKKEYYDKIKKYRDKNYSNPNLGKKLRVWISFLSSYIVYNKIIYGLLQGLRDKIPSLGEATNMESWDLAKITLPNDNLEKMTKLQAKLGIVQLSRLEKHIQKRKKIAKWYNKYLKVKEKSPLVKGAVYSHYNVLVKNRGTVIKELRKKGVNVGTAMDYSVPDTTAYKKYSKGKKFPNSKKVAAKIINLPFYYSLKERDVRKISKIINEVLAK